MGFFEDIDELGIVERHIKALLGLEEDKASALVARYKEVRLELRDRLERMPQGSFSAQQLRGVLVQIDAAVEAMNRALLLGMRDTAAEAALAGVEDQLTEIRAFSEHFKGAVVPLNVNALAVATDANQFLFNRYEASLNAYGEGVRSQLVSQLTNYLIYPRSTGDINQAIGQYFAGEEWKLERLARTEIHNIYNVSKMRGLSSVRDTTMPELMKALVHPMDQRTGDDSKALRKQNPIVPIEDPFEFTWKGKTRTFMAPPDRPNDRAILVPYDPSWG